MSIKTHRSRWDPLSDSRKHKFRVQSTPPLSIRQFVRSTITVIPGGKPWKPAGIYHVPVVHDDKSPKSSNNLPEIVIKPHKTARSPWYPSGKPHYEPVPHFDAPSLRWSPQQIRESMPEFIPITKKSPTNQK